MTIIPSRNVEIGAYQPLVTTFSSADRYIAFLCVSVYRHIIDYLLFIPSRWPHSGSTALQLNPNEASLAHVFSPRGALLPPCAEEHWTALHTTFWGHLKQWNHHQNKTKKSEKCDTKCVHPANSQNSSTHNNHSQTDAWSDYLVRAIVPLLKRVK